MHQDIRNECYSAGAILALGADCLVMTESSYLGKVDPQESSSLGGMTQLTILASMPDEYINGRNYYNVMSARYMVNYTKSFLDHVLDGKDLDLRQKVYYNMLYSETPHCQLFDKETLESFGLKVREPTDDDLKYFE